MLGIDEIKKVKYPYELFSDDIDEIKIQYVDLMKAYHPDLNGQRKEYIEVIEKINKLYKEGEENIKKGIWNKPGFIKLKCIEGNVYTMKFRISHTFELGRMYIGDFSILYLIDEEKEGLALNYLKMIKELKYTNDEMEREFQKYLPKVISKFKTISGKIGIVINKDEDLILLRDLLAYYDGVLSEKIVTEILSNLYNIICFMNFNNLTHNSITIDSYFFSLKSNRGALLGGWWYSTKAGDDLLEVPIEIQDIIPYEMMRNKKSNSKLDLESIRVLGRILLGDKTGFLLIKDHNISKELRLWLREDAGSNPFNEYSDWSNVVKNIFKNRKFVKINVDNDDLYRKLDGF